MSCKIQSFVGRLTSVVVAFAMPLAALALESNRFSGSPMQPSWIKGQTPPAMCWGSPKYNGELETASRTQASLASLAPGDYTTKFSVPASGNYAAVSTTASFTVYPETEKPAYEYEWVEFPSANVHSAFDTGIKFNHRKTKLELKYQKTDDRYGMYLSASDDDDTLKYSTRLFIYDSDGFVVCQPNYNNAKIDESSTARADREVRVITLTGTGVTYKGATTAYKSQLADANTTDTLWIGTGDHFGGRNRSPYYGIGHRFYYLKMWTVGTGGDTLVHHWVPVKTTSGATMLYDKVTEQLLPPFAISGSTLTLGGAVTPMGGQSETLDLPTQTSPAADAVLATQNAMHKEFYAKSMANRVTIASSSGWSANTGKYSDGAKYRLRMFNEGGCYPVQTKFSWTGNGPFTLEIRRAADRSLFYRQENIAGTSFLVDNLEVGTEYLWSVGNANGFSPWRAFSTETDVPRFLRGCANIPYVTSMGKIERNQYEAVTNLSPHGVRDLGGYAGRDGRRVRQGLAIRTSEFDGEKGSDVVGVSFVTDENRAFWHDFLGIKTDIDLRNSGEWNKKASPLADAEHPVAWKNFTAFPKNGSDLASATSRNNLRDAIRLFANRANYPIAFHCVHGKDRTGCLSYMILGLLGVSQNDLHKDFEGTLFWHPYQPDTNLTSLDDYIMSNALASPGTTLNERIESYVKNIGVSANDIAAIREIMLEPKAVVAQPTIVAPADYAKVSTKTPYLRDFISSAAAIKASTYGTKGGTTRGKYEAEYCTNCIPVRLAWSGPVGSCAVKVYLASGSTPVFETQSTTGEAFFCDPELGRNYRWTVTSGGKTATGHFYVEREAPRIIGEDTVKQYGNANVGNARDLGGWTTEDGKVVKQGLVYRSRQFDWLRGDPCATRYWVESIGIRLDLDLRKLDGEIDTNIADYGGTRTQSPLSDGIRRYTPEFEGETTYQFKTDGTSITDKNARIAFYHVFKQFLNDANYPIVFHCSHGKDRTGQLAMIILGYLGVPIDGIKRDYCCSWIYGSSWTLSALQPDNIVSALNTRYKAKSSTLAGQCEAYIKECAADAGATLTDAQLSAFRAKMLEDAEIPLTKDDPEPEPKPELYDYLQTDGKGYIVTDYQLKPTTRVEMKFQLLSDGLANNQSLFWLDDSADGAEWGCTLWDSGSAGYYYNAGDGVTFADNLTDTAYAHLVKAEGITAQLDERESVTGALARPSLPEKNIMLFASRSWKSGHAVQYHAKVRLYAFRIYEGSVLKRDYVPAKKNGVAGLYDRVSGAFVSASGTGAAFTVGSGVAPDPAPSANEVWAVLGDSYSTFGGHPGVTNPYYPTGDVTAEDQTWWSQVIARFGGEAGKVVAAAGSRISGEAMDGDVHVASFYDRVKNGELGNPDHLLVMGGLNDWWGEIPDSELFGKTCELFDLLDTKYTKARKIVVLLKRPGDFNVGLPSVYRSALKQAAQDHGYTVVDLDGVYTETATDMAEGHPNASGMAKIASRVIASLEGTYAPSTHAHQYGEWVTTVPATETTAGERTRTCVADGCSYPLATEVERLPPTGSPDTYDYLLSDGVGYLLTDWRLTPTTHVELEFKLMADQKEGKYTCQSFFWLDDLTGKEWGCTQWSKGGSIGYYYDVGDMEISSGLSDTANRYVISAGGTNAFLGTLPHPVSTAGAQAISNERIILFASRDWESHRIQYHARIKLYSFKVWDDAVSTTEPVRIYLPVKDANGVATLYDTVTKTYLDAPVGGTFEVGDDGDEPVVVTKVAKPTLAAIWAGRDGANHCPSVTVTPAGAYTVEYSNGGNWTAVGDYTATCRLADTARYAWADGTTDDVVLTFAVIDQYDYLESDGHGYLLTDYPFDIAKTHVEMKFQTMIDQEDKPYANQSFFWIDNATSGDEWGCTQWGKGGGIGYYYNSGEASVTDALPDFDNTHTIRAWGNTVQLDGRAPVSGSASAPASLPHVNIMLFASRDWKTQEVHYEARIRIDSFKIWEFDETNPVRNYVAVKRADGSSTFFDTVTGVYLDPSTGGFVAGNREQKETVGRFIQTDGKGYFDLGFKPHLRNTRIEIVSTLDPNQGGQGILWAGSSKVMGLCAYPNDGAFTYYVTRVGGTDEGDGVACPDSCHMGDMMVHTMTVGGSSFVIDGVETPCGYETEDAEADGNAILFLNEYQGEPAVKLYSVKVWDVSRTPAALVHSFVPGTSADQLYDEVDGTSVTAQRVTSGTAYSFQLGQDAMIDLPTLTRTTFDYDNTEKRPLPESETFTQFGDVAKTAPGTYTVRVVPNGGYCWSDGSHAVREIEWTINGSWNPVATDFGISNRITVAEQDYCVLTFTNTAAAGWNWTVPAGVTEFEFLVAAGGGGGGAGNGYKDLCRTGGGGGAGGVVTGRVANASGTFTVKVGAGGARGATLGANGANGGDSSLKLGGVNYVTAKGGGAGGGARYASKTDTGSNGAAGGSGGGGSAKDNHQTTAGGATTAAEVGCGVTAWQSFGNAGGGGYHKNYAGGGGGACGAGESASAANTKNGEGGAGLVSPISGELATYGRGGGTAYYGAAGDGAAATAATGNGGAGGHGDGDNVGFYGEAGGSGVVVIRYATSALPPTPPEVDTYDWLLADGNGYIETDYVPNLKKTRIEVVYEQTSHDSGFFWMANACTAPGGSGSGRQMCNLSFGLHGAAGEELQYGQANGGDEHELRYGTPERYVVVTNVTKGADVWRNGVHHEMPGYTADGVWASGPLVLFAGNWAGKYADGKKAMLKAKVYRVTISEVDGATAEVRYNFVPATDAYGRATMYDTVSGQFAAVLGDEAGYTVGNGYPTKPEPEPTPDPTATVAPVAVAPASGATVDILTPTQRQFLAKSAAERRADYVSQAQRRNLGSWDYGYCDPQPLTLRWEGAGAGSVGRCTVRVWRVKDGVETLHFEREVLGCSTTVDNFEVAADYRWEVSNAIGTAGGTFTTRDETPRLLRDPDPQQRITGIRDLGGRIGLNGRRVRQNLVFRSSRLNGPESLDENFITDANRSWWRDTLKIKTDLDLRSDTEEVGVWKTTPIPDATWEHVSANSYANFVKYPASFKTCFNLFLDANNYPFVFHCVAGQDRTGCLAFVLESLLGVDADECLKDWEANAFRNSDVTWNHEAGIDKFIAGFDGEAGDTLTERIVSWVKKQGYSDDDINRFRELMLEPAPVGPVDRCDYLQTDGIGWLDLGFKPHLRNTRIEVVSTVDAETSGANAMAWAHSDAQVAATHYRIGYAFWPSGNFEYYVSTGSEKEKEHGSSLVVPADKDGIHTVYFGGTDFVVDGVRAPVDELPDDQFSGENVKLFVSRPDNYQASPCVKLYSVKVWEVDGATTNLVRHFVPVRVGDGATLCDILAVTPTPLAVQGSGAHFTAGDDTEVSVPTCETTFGYDGTAKRPLECTADYTVVGDVEATIPGAYQLRVVPNGGRCWADDGSHDVRVIGWTITGSWDPVETAFGVSNKITVASRDYCILAFTNTATAGWNWTVPTGVSEFEFLVVAGGGGGGAGQQNHEGYCRKGGGGGAGGVVTGLVANASGTFTVKVGVGGARGAAFGANGEKGGDSSVVRGEENYVTAKGGGYGGGARYASTTDTGNAGGAGGSGGGGSSRNGTNTRAGGASEAPAVGAGVTAYEAFGNAGGSGTGKSGAGIGGGAGAGGADGGAGLVCAISGLPVTYACGGATGYRGTANDGAAAAMSTGNGGAGGHGSSEGVGYYGEAGGSGIVIIRYAVPSEPVDDVIRRKVAEAKSGESVLPTEVAFGDVTLAADGKSFAYGGKTYAKEHYVFQAKDGTLIALVAPDEKRITSAGFSASGDKFQVGTIDATVEGFRYAVEYADVLGGEWTVYSVSKPGAGQKLILEAPMSDTGDHRFYRIVVTDIVE